MKCLCPVHARDSSSIGIGVGEPSKCDETMRDEDWRGAKRTQQLALLATPSTVTLACWSVREHSHTIGQRGSQGISLAVSRLMADIMAILRLGWSDEGAEDRYVSACTQHSLFRVGEM